MTEEPEYSYGPCEKNRALLDYEELLSLIVCQDANPNFTYNNQGHVCIKLEGKTFNLSLILKNANLEYFFLPAKHIEKLALLAKISQKSEKYEKICNKYMNEANVPKSWITDRFLASSQLDFAEVYAMRHYTLTSKERCGHYFIDRLLAGESLLQPESRFNLKAEELVELVALTAILVSAVNKNSSINEPFAYPYVSHYTDKKITNLPPTMLSTTFSENAAKFREFGRTCYRINENRQRPIYQISYYPKEYEVLYPPGMFLVQETTKPLSQGPAKYSIIRSPDNISDDYNKDLAAAANFDAIVANLDIQIVELNAGKKPTNAKPKLLQHDTSDEKIRKFLNNDLIEKEKRTRLKIKNLKDIQKQILTAMESMIVNANTFDDLKIIYTTFHNHNLCRLAQLERDNSFFCRYTKQVDGLKGLTPTYGCILAALQKKAANLGLQCDQQHYFSGKTGRRQHIIGNIFALPFRCCMRGIDEKNYRPVNGVNS